MSDNIQEAEVGSGTKISDTKQSEKRAQLTLKAIQLRLKQEKERAALQAQKKSLSVKEDIEESFSPSQIAALKAEYSKINGIDPDSDTYKKLIAMLDRLDLKTLKSLAGAEIKFVSKLAQNRVLRKSMRKEDVQLDENEDLANARKMYHKHFVAAMKAMPSSIVQKRHQDEMEKYKKIMGNSFIDQVAPSKFAKFDKKIKEEMQIDEQHSVLYKMKKTDPKIAVAHYKSKDDADKFLASVKEKGGNGVVRVGKIGLDLTSTDKKINELSNEKLADYKKKAGENASAADKAGDTKKGNKRFSGIMKATRKQFDNDAKKTNEELSPKQKALDKNKNGKIDGEDLAKLRGEELSAKQKALDKNNNGKIDGSDLAHLRSKKKQPQGADFAAQRRKERLASNGRMDEQEMSDGDKSSMALRALVAKKKLQQTSGKNKSQAFIDRMVSRSKLLNQPKPDDEYKRKVVQHLKKKYNEETINEKSDYETYHKDYSSAVQTAIKQAEKRGYEVDMDDWHDKVATGPKKPSSGKTNSFSINLMKDGKPSKKKLQMQVYNMDNHKYELNMYIEEIQLDELNKDTLHSYANKSEKDQDKQYDKIGKGIRDKDPKSANKAGHKFSMRSIGQNRAEKRLAKEDVVDEAGPGLWANIHAKRERIKNGSNERMRKPGEKGAPESDALDRARGKNEAASPAQQAAIAIAMKKDGKKPKNMAEADARVPRQPGQPANSKAHSDLYTDENPKDTIQGLKFATVEDAEASVSKIRNSGRTSAHKVQAAVAMEQRAKAAGKDSAAAVYRTYINSVSKKETYEGVVDKIKAIKRGMQAKAKADDHFDKAGDPKNANASKDLKKAVRYSNLLNKEEVVLEARKKSFKDVKKKMKEEEVPSKSTVKKGDMLTGKREPIEINPELKEPAR